MLLPSLEKGNSVAGVRMNLNLHYGSGRIKTKGLGVGLERDEDGEQWQRFRGGSKSSV